MKMSQEIVTKECSKCGLNKAITEFSIHHGKVRDKRCKKCMIVIKNNPDKDFMSMEIDSKPTDYNYFGWQGGKYVGTFFEYNKGKSLKICVGNYGNQFQQCIAFNKFNSREEAYKEAQRIKEEASD